MFRARGRGRGRRGGPGSRITPLGVRARRPARASAWRLVVLGRRLRPSRRFGLGATWRFRGFVARLSGPGGLGVRGRRRLSHGRRALRRGRRARFDGVGDRLNRADPHGRVGAARKRRRRQHQHRHRGCSGQGQLPNGDRAVAGRGHVESCICGQWRRRCDAVQLRAEALVKVRPQLISHFQFARS
jgi:hypothetical protein